MTHDSGPPAAAFRPRRRILAAAALAATVVAALSLWAATGHRDLDPPLMIAPALGSEPSTAVVGATPSSPPPSAPSSRATPRATRSPSASPSPSPSRSASSAPRKPLRSPSPSATTPPPAFAARYVGGAERRGSFSAGVVLENEGRTARAWEVRITYDGADRVRVDRAFGAQVGTSGSTVVFTGGPLAAGEDTMFGFRAETTGDGWIRPTSCQVDGRACTISFR